MPEHAEFIYRPFLTAIPVWDYWVWLILPLCIGVSVAWKAMKSERVSDLPRDVLRLSGVMVGGYLLAAALVLIVSRFGQML
jgi:CHASE2 domain-containing sensor protein